MIHLKSESTLEDNIAYLCGSLMAEEECGVISFEDMYNLRLKVFLIMYRDREKRLISLYGKNPYGGLSPAEVFENMYAENVRVIQKFPREILNEVADIRLLALGFGGEAVKKALERYIICGA